MANVLFAARQATSDVLSTVSSSAHAVAVTANAASHYAGMIELHAKDAKETYSRTLASDQTQRVHRGISERALNDAIYHSELDDRLNADPKLKALYDKVVLNYQTADAKALTQE